MFMTYLKASAQFCVLVLIYAITLKIKHYG